MPTPNLGLIIPVGGTTPGAPNNTTAGTYPNIEETNLGLIDSLCYSAANPVSVAGFNVNADLSFNGWSLLDANNGTFAGTMTAGAVSATTIAVTSTLSVAGAISESTAATALTLKGHAAATGGVAVILDNPTAQTSGLALSVRTGGVEVANIDFHGTITAGNGSGSGYQLTMDGEIGVISLSGGSGPQGLTIEGNPGTVTGPSIAIDTNAVTMTAGAILTIANNGTVVASVDFSGSLFLANHLRTNGSAPALSGVPGGTFSSSVLAGTDVTGVVTLTTTTGSPTISTGQVAIVAFAKAQANTNYTVNLFPASLLTLTGSQVFLEDLYVSSKSTTQFIISTVASGLALSPSSGYGIGYTVLNWS